MVEERRPFRVIGKSHPRVDVVEKVSGSYSYVGDMSVPGMLHAKVLRSPHAHARVKRIDTRGAEAVPGVRAVLTPDDVLDKPVYRANAVSPSAPNFTDAHILEQEVRHVGDRVAAVAATSVEAAEEAIAKIEVEYERLPAVFDFEEAMQPDAPSVHEAVLWGGTEIPIVNNSNSLPGMTEGAFGDVEEGLRKADVVVENTFRTGRPHNAPLNCAASLCRPLPGGGLEIWSHSQGIHPHRICLAASLGITLGKIRLHRVSPGGAFGLYIYVHFTDFICAALALKAGMPVKLEDTREEMFLDGGRHPALIKLRTGAMKDGTLVAMDMWLADGVGAYEPLPGMCSLMCGFFLSKYRCPNKRFDGRSVYTNTPPLCAMRGAGNPQVHFAVESQMDILAEELGMDPVELRRKNNPGEGDHFIGQGMEITSSIQSCGLEQLVHEGAKRIGWDNRKGYAPYEDRPWIKRGIGMASGFHTSGAGSEKPASYMLDYSGAIVKMNEDGTANLTLAAVDFGSGNVTAMAVMAAEELGIRYEDVIVTDASTENSLYEHWIHASRSVYSVGGAVKAASGKAKDMILDWAGLMLEVPARDLDTGDGRVFSVKDPSQGTTIREVLEFAQSQGLGTAIGTTSHRATACPPHFVVTFVEVDVDTLTGAVKLVRVFQSADVGTPINPEAVRGQLVGGLHMGMGYALTEDVVYDPEDGHVVNPNFKDYKLLTALDMPDVETLLADSVEPTGPFGAKGVGEGATNTVAPAVYNAVYNAVGVRICTMPLTPEKIVDALKVSGKTAEAKPVPLAASPTRS